MGNFSDRKLEDGEVTEVEDRDFVQGERNSENGFDDAATSARDLEIRQNEPRSTWLCEELMRYRINLALIHRCEDILIVREGFVTAEIFASISPAKMTHEYLTEIGVIQLGLQGVLLTVHKNLRDEISLAEVSNLPSPAVKWLRSKLHTAHTLPQLQRECEWKLVSQEGITSKDLFASLPENVFNVGFLKKIGIVGLGLQHLLLEYHAELHYAYLQQLNYMARAQHVMPQKVGHKRGAEQMGDNRHNGDVQSDSEVAGNSSNSSKKQRTHKSARHDELKLEVENID